MGFKKIKEKIINSTIQQAGRDINNYFNVSTHSATEIFKIKRCAIRSIDLLHYIFQINIVIHPEYKTYLRQIELINQGGVYGNINIPINYLFELDATETDYLKLDYDDCRKTIEAMERIPVSSIIIEPDEWKYYAILAFETGERLSDGYEDFLLHDWVLKVKYNDSEERFVINFKIHSLSSKICIRYRYINFGNYNEPDDVENS